MVSAKRQAQEVIDQLPDDCTMEDIQYHLYVVETIRHRLAQADQASDDRWIPQDEVERRVAKWIIK